MEVEKLQERLGYQFGERGTLLQALTHTSYGHENLQEKAFNLRDNERLEYLGDSVLDLVVSDLLLEIFPDSNEGQLSKMRAAVVNEKALAQIARDIGLHLCLRLGKGEIQSGGIDKPSILSSTFEAVVAAIYIDGGFYAVFPVLRHLFSPYFKSDESKIPIHDHKTKLQEIVQAKHRVTPTYHVVEAHGPDHAKIFSVEVRIHGKPLGTASGPSKKEAEQNAARAVMELTP